MSLQFKDEKAFQAWLKEKGLSDVDIKLHEFKEIQAKEEKKHEIHKDVKVDEEYPIEGIVLSIVCVILIFCLLYALL